MTSLAVEIVAEWPGSDGTQQATRSLPAIEARGDASWREVSCEPFS